MRNVFNRTTLEVHEIYNSVPRPTQRMEITNVYFTNNCWRTVEYYGVVLDTFLPAKIGFHNALMG